jgi:penicillin amidase/acyl-homoserine-lactone acylase
VIRRTSAAAALLPALALGACIWPSRGPGPAAAPERRAPSAYDVRILRDTWGVPHVFGTTDADAAYGLAWAHAEDDFRTIQISLLASRGELARATGRKGAANDFLVHWLRIPETVERGWPQVSPEARAVAEAYAAGINAYAARHRREVLRGVLPVRGQDLVAGFVHKNALFILRSSLRVLFDDERPIEDADWQANAAAEGGPPVGSNAFAVGPARSADGRTRLAINSHQPWQGPVAWYEAHVHSEEGWNAVGGVFPGAPVILHGHNPHLGWAHTVNRPDLVDVFRLQIDPDDPDRYRFDGEWRTLEKRDVRMLVKLGGPFSWPVRREALWSVQGPVVRRHDGTFAIRYAGIGETGQLDQVFRMNKARNFEEFLSAMRLGGVAMFNTVYADETGTIYYVYNARIPGRWPGYDWSGVVPGDSSETLWTEYVPFDELPHVRNPHSGFVQNCNSTPFLTTLGDADNPQPEAFPPRLGIETRMTNRAWRALELLGATRQVDDASFEAVKWDMAYSPRSQASAWIDEVLAVQPVGDAELRRAHEQLAAWDRRTDPDNRGAALGVLTLAPFLEARRNRLDPPAPLDALRDASQLLMQHHGRLDVPWNRVQRLRRGNLDLGLGGGPDILRAIYHERSDDGRVRGKSGDSYLLLVSWGPDGVRSQSVHQYGSATLDERSPHYADQAPLFAARQLKPVWIEEADVRAHLERAYRPPQPRGR